MMRLVWLAVFLPSLAAANGELCAAWSNPIEADMRVRESDLTAERVASAREFLAKHGEDKEDEFTFGRANAKTVISGHTLRASAASGGPKEVAAFCAWLTKEGFWHD